MSFVRSSGKIWFEEWFSKHESHLHEVKSIIVEKKTKYQVAYVVDTYSFGRCLILDQEIQSSIFDEYIYHEALVLPSLISHKSPQNVLILGGGEGATAREVLKAHTIHQVSMVDIDAEVIDFCREHLSSWHQGAFDDKKVHLHIGDAKKYVEETQQKFDIIISDLPSPIATGPANQLYTAEFYRNLIRKLKDDGIFVLQAGSTDLIQIELHAKLYKTLSSVFSFVFPYSVYVPSFDVPWGFILCSQDASNNPVQFSPDRIDQLISQKIKSNLKFYDGISHQRLFSVPKDIRNILNSEKDIITLENPVYFYK